VPIEHGLGKWLRQGIAFALHSPAEFFTYMFALLRGTWYVCLYSLCRRNVRIRFPFYAHARVRISGPGCVEIGSGCDVFSNTHVGLSIVTLSPRAKVTIGRNSSLGGLVVRARHEVSLGDRVRTAYCLIQDDLFLHLDCVRSRQSVLVPKDGVVIGADAWVALNACVLTGTHLGVHTVVAAGSVVFRRHIQEAHFVTGNPSLSSLPIPHLLRLRG
jgi:acetyltransferase-like isoleucine patch superfamily enzyme